MIERYNTISKNSEGYFTDKKSKFYSYTFQVKNIEEVKNILKEMKKLHPKSNHLPYAFRCGIINEEMGFSDDSEPTGSAGKPILFEIEREKLKNTLIVVARYFGGVKLGVGGLVRAFSSAARNAVENTEIIIKDVSKLFQIEFIYEKIGEIESFLRQNQIEILEKEFDKTCKFQIIIKYNLSEEIIKNLKQFSIINVTELEII